MDNQKLSFPKLVEKGVDFKSMVTAMKIWKELKL